MSATTGSFAARLAREPVVLDGGLATELERRGHDLGDALWSARLLRDRPAAIEAVHRAYFEAGADVAISASYQASYEGFAAVGVGREETTRLLRLSVELADGSEYTGDYGATSADQLAAVQRPRIAALLAAEPDVLALETIPSVREVAAVAELLGELPQAEAWMTFCCRDGERLSDGTPVEEAVRIAAGARNVVAVGVNCTAPEHVGALLERASACTELPLLAYPNSGRTWDAEHGEWRGAGVDRFPAAVVSGWQASGARGIGGCCGIGPAAI